MRGKPQFLPRFVRFCRITPAGAGKTKEVELPEDIHTDHPRRCGENLTLGQPSIIARGSPPQVRGKRRQEDKKPGMLRITPAGAGKTGVARRIKCRLQDHPRRCGENLSLSLFRCSLLGSPPQVRGKQKLKHEEQSHQGITPAGAGKTPAFYLPVGGSRDHPRRCGENTDCIQKFQFLPGSPPQVRGKQKIKLGQDWAIGITPAGAGKTSTPLRIT